MSKFFLDDDENDYVEATTVPETAELETSCVTLGKW